MDYLICFEAVRDDGSRDIGDSVYAISRLTMESLEEVRKKLSQNGTRKVVFRSITKLDE